MSDNAPKGALTNPFALSSDDGYTWLKGNLHSHTTNSDGKAAPQERLDGYVGQGYDFLCLSDHHKITFIDTVQAPSDFVLIQGAELHPDNPFGGQRHHFVCLNFHEDINAEKMPPSTSSTRSAAKAVRSGWPTPIGVRSTSCATQCRFPGSPALRSSTPPAAAPDAASRACIGTTGWI